MIANNENSNAVVPSRTRRSALADISNRSEVETNINKPPREILTRSHSVPTEAPIRPSTAEVPDATRKPEIRANMRRTRSSHGTSSNPLNKSTEDAVESSSNSVKDVTKERRASEESTAKKMALERTQSHQGPSKKLSQIISTSSVTSEPVTSSTAPSNAASTTSATNTAINTRPAIQTTRPKFQYPLRFLPPKKIVRTFPLQRKNSDPSECLEIIDQMYEMYYVKELETCPRPYMDKQSDINEKMRSILIDWIINIHLNFNLQSPTLWLCVNILDRYLECTDTLRLDLQLIGMTCLLIAAKFEEMCSPEVNEFVFVADSSFSREDILSMEVKILEKLKYDICVPTVYTFLVRYCNAIAANDIVKHMASYYAERNLQEYDSLLFPPHVIAAGALYAALRQQQHPFLQMQNTSVWPQILQDETGLSEVDVMDCARQLVLHVDEEQETASKRKLIAAKRKYASSKYMSVSTFDIPVL